MSRLPIRVALRSAPAEIRSRTTAAAVRMVRREPFEFDGRTYNYLIHHHNTTWRNERTVEVPIAVRVLDERSPARVLEVGNVLRNYLPENHPAAGRVVVDMYEVGAGVQNIDVLDHEPDAPYDVIVALSTLEHVGLDEDVVEPDKAARAIELMQTWLAPGGVMLVTVPLGYHSELDRRLLEGPVLFDDLKFMRRVSADGRWEQADADQVRGARFGSPYPFANVIAVGRTRG